MIFFAIVLERNIVNDRIGTNRIKGCIEFRFFECRTNYRERHPCRKITGDSNTRICIGKSLIHEIFCCIVNNNIFGRNEIVIYSSFLECSICSTSISKLVNNFAIGICKTTKKFDYSMTLTADKAGEFPLEMKFSVSVENEGETMVYDLTEDDTMEMYYYDVQQGGVDMLDVAFGAYVPAIEEGDMINE